MPTKNLKEGDKIVWIHKKADEFSDIDSEDSRLKKLVTVKKLFEDRVKTDFGTYFLESGENIDAPCGCKRFCDCYGKVVFE